MKQTPGRIRLAALLERHLEEQGGTTSETVAQGLVDLLVDSPEGRRVASRAQSERAKESLGSMLRQAGDVLQGKGGRS